MTAFVERLGDAGARRRSDVELQIARGGASLATANSAPADGATAVAASGALPTGDRRASAAADQQRMIACVAVRAASYAPTRAERLDVLSRLSLLRLQRSVRPGDQMCMLGGSRFAICLGSGADRLTPHALGRRLARAVGDHLAVGPSGLDLQVAIGIGTGAGAVSTVELTGAAMASIRFSYASANAVGRNGQHSMVTIAHVPERLAFTSVHRCATAPRVSPSRRAARHDVGIVRRVLVSASDSADAATSRQREAQFSSVHTLHGAPVLSVTPLRVLFLDPHAEPELGPGPAVEAVATSARRVGVEPFHADAEPESILLKMLVSEPDVVVVVLRPETPRRDAGQDAAYTWDAAAQLVRVVRDTGTPVVAVSMGGSAAALAVCVEQGAVGVLHVDLLPQELDRQAARRHNTNGAASQNGHDDPNRPAQLPGPYDALVHLTPSERRVLFHMMEGRSAADIATILVVSLTTVRSHIRSILRKLNVNSQLAAVALAFGTLPEPAVTD